MKFWKKSEKGSSRSLSNSASSNPLLTKDDDYILSKKQQTKFVTTSVPTRYERMKLLNAVIRHADAMQRQFAPPKTDGVPTESTSMIKSFTGESSKILSLTSNSTAVIKEMNEKAYNRWQTVLQEGLVPMAVRGLGLLETVDEAGSCKCNDEEEEYFSSLQGMEEEIQMMAILGRAAALCESSDDTNDSGVDMQQINSMMKCTAMLMFHIVMMASTPADDDANCDDKKNATKSAAGYDGRVRHVLKMSCVDVLTRAILDSVEAYEQSQENAGTEAAEVNATQDTESKLYDVDEYTLWNMPNIKTFVDEHNIGKEAIFGTIWNKKTSEMFGLLGKKHESKPELQQQQEDKLIQNDPQQRPLQIEDAEQLPIVSEQQTDDSEEFPSIEEMHSDLLLTDEMNDDEATPDTNSVDLCQNKGNEAEKELSDENPTGRAEIDQVCQQSNHGEAGSEQLHETLSHEINSAEGQTSQQLSETQDDQLKGGGETEQDKRLKLEQEEKEAHLAKRQLNAKFLASRKFELIERTVAIDVVRFLMAEERERKLREKEQKEQKNKFMNVVEMIKKATEDDSEKVDGTADGESADKEATDGDPNESVSDGSSYWTSHRKKQALRSLKIAGVGLTLGTVFAVTGGLAGKAFGSALINFHIIASNC